MNVSLWCFAACWMILFAARLFLCACHCLSNFLILLFSHIAWLVLSVTGAMLAWNGLKQKESIFNNKFFNILGLVLNVLAIGFTLINSPILVQYWHDVNTMPHAAEALKQQALESLLNHDEVKNKEDKTP